jgi:glucoamylase
MTPLSPTQWTAVVTATASTSLSYKYDLGGSWDNVEETAGCGYVANRTMSVDGGSVDDTVAAWAALGSC